MPARKPIIPGERFGRLVVVVGNAFRKPNCQCLCDCGNTATVSVRRLRSGGTRSCGCLRHEAHTATHGHTRGGFSPTYRSWANMLARTKYDYFPDYCGRGVTVCQRWAESFESFLADMGERPSGTSIDRIDNAKGYEPGNCRWATEKTQKRNTTRNKQLTYNGETRALAEWAEVLGLNYSAVKQRINKLGWDVESAFKTPVRALRRGASA
jgi:hypothetical protein